MQEVFCNSSIANFNFSERNENLKPLNVEIIADF